jgi:hypothetical protein
MRMNNKLIHRFACVLLCALWPFATVAQAASINAASCNASDVQNAISAANPGDTINVPRGSCSWQKLTVAKPVTLNGAGQGVTTIALGTSSSALAITKQTTGVIRIQNFTFTLTNSKQTPHAVTVGGPWPTGQPVIFQNNTITLSNADFLTVLSAGGVIFSRITVTGGWGDTLVTGKDASNNSGSWTSPSSLGAKDTTGYKNIYIEDSTFKGGNISDCDDNCRMVLRYSTMNDSTGFNSHGYDTSPWGMRHFEIYNNTFHNSCSENGTCSSQNNINQMIWIRGGTGVVYNNWMANNSNGYWGTKPQVRISGRAYAEPSLIGVSCTSLTYPQPRQPGQGYETSRITDPIYFWGNTGPTWAVSVTDEYTWSNTCSNHSWSEFFQWDRDAINKSMRGGTPKPGYTPYTYPHPLTQGTASSPSPATPAAPTNLTAIPK